MPLLSRPTGKPPSPRRRASAHPAPTLAVVADSVEVSLGETTISALPDGALWIAEAKTLVVSDLHLEKGSAFAVRGQMLPPYDTHAALTKLAALIERLKPDIVVSLGDSFHDSGGPVRMTPGDRALLQDMIARCDWIWIEGNHDSKSAEPLGGVVCGVLRLGSIVLCHEPTDGLAPGEIAGHLHPCAKVAGRGRSVRRRCFATDGWRMVMPAFGVFTGGLNIRDAAFDPIFPDGAAALVLGRNRVLPVLQERLLSD